MAELSPASAGDAVARLLAAAGPILSLDIGSGTQDVLLALPVSPSPFRNKRQPGSPPPLLLMRPSPCTTIPSA